MDTDYWQSRMKSISERLEYLHDHQPFRDVRFRVEERTQVQHFNAHKVILASASPVFSEYFYGNASQDTELHVTVRRDTITLNAFGTMLRFIYGLLVEFDSAIHALQTYKVADKYRVHPLKDLVIGHFSQCILSPLDVVQLVDDNVHLEIVGLHQKCLDKAECKPLEVIRLAAEKACEPDTIHTFLQMDSACLSSELAILKELLDGIRARIQRNDPRIRFIRKFLKDIRFLTMTPQEFAIALDICGSAITMEEGFMIFRVLSHPENGGFPLPSWCNSLTRRRTTNSRDIKELRLMPSQIINVHYDSDPITGCDGDLVNVLEVKVLDGRFIFTGVELSYRRVVTTSSAITQIPSVRYALIVWNNESNLHYKRIGCMDLEENPTILNFPIPLPVAQDQQARITVMLENHLVPNLEFGRFRNRRYVAESDQGKFEVSLNNYRTSEDETFALSKLFYIQ